MATPFRFSARSRLRICLDRPSGPAFTSRIVPLPRDTYSIAYNRPAYPGEDKRRVTATAATESQIRVLIDAVDRADRAGNRGEAERALAQARAAAPDDPRVLNVAGMRALLGGDAGAARPLLERAAALDPGSPMLWLNLALAHRELRDEGAERDALERALLGDRAREPGHAGQRRRARGVPAAAAGRGARAP